MRRAWAVAVLVLLAGGCTTQSAPEPSASPEPPIASPVPDTIATSQPAEAPTPAPEAYLKTVAGYGYVTLAPEQQSVIAAAFDKAELRQYTAGVASRLVSHGEDSGLLLLVIALQPAYSSTPGVLEAIKSGVGQPGTATTVGGLPAYSFVAPNSTIKFVMYLQRTFVTAVYGQDLNKVGAFATAIIEANRDRTAPATKVTVTPDADANGWRKASVTVGITAQDEPAGSGLRRVQYVVSGQGVETKRGTFANSATVTVARDGTARIMVSAEDWAGNTEPAQFIDIKIDKTPPHITFTGNNGSYALYDQIAISCAAKDDTSGLATTTCEPVTGFALSFGLGDRLITRSATDVAGNVAVEGVRFSVAITPAVVAGALVPPTALILLLVMRRRRPPAAAAPVPAPTEPQSTLPN
ncbi:MAG TPA: hypothetical protein VGR87_02145 [Candidatus Limnocylindria bacterium]|nr:hypothetical protein [Candidatus Limnocylindria bacterium]